MKKRFGVFNLDHLVSAHTSIWAAKTALWTNFGCDEHNGLGITIKYLEKDNTWVPVAQASIYKKGN